MSLAVNLHDFCAMAETALMRSCRVFPVAFKNSKGKIPRLLRVRVRHSRGGTVAPHMRGRGIVAEAKVKDKTRTLATKTLLPASLVLSCRVVPARGVSAIKRGVPLDRPLPPARKSCSHIGAGGATHRAGL